MSKADGYREMARGLLNQLSHPDVRTNEDVMTLTSGATVAALLAIDARLGELVEQGKPLHFVAEGGKS